ncbi:MAG: hypothetical protein HYR94_08050 [Chloroflexi bacterium]|nr:hypothetical protein [Chloroflexota bacterium]
MAQYGQFVFASTFSNGHIYSTTGPTNISLTVDAGGPYIVNEGDSVAVTATGDDPNGASLTFAWDLDNNGTFETPGQSATLSAAGLDGPSSHTIAVQVSDSGGLSATAQATVDVLNVAPTVDAGPDQIVFRNDIVALSGTWTDPVGGLDDPYSWAWDVTGDGMTDNSGAASYGSAVAQTASFAVERVYNLIFQVTDKDGGVGSDSLRVTVLNQPPDCSAAAPSINTIWPPNHQFVPVNVLGVTDPEGDPVAITIDAIRQDEPVDTQGDGQFVPDGQGVGTATTEVRAERVGTKKEPGNGRVYHIGFTADDGHGGSCSSEVLVGVPHDQGSVPVDDGALYDSTVP